MLSSCLQLVSMRVIDASEEQLSEDAATVASHVRQVSYTDATRAG